MAIDDEPKIGAVIELGSRLRNMTRRQFVKTLGVAGTGVAGLGSMIETAYGQEPEGVPIVYTYDIYDNPEQVRIISEERYRRLKTFVSLPEEFMARNPLVNEVSIVQQSDDDEDLALVLYVDELTSTLSDALPDSVQNVPIIYRERSGEIQPNYCGYRHDRRSPQRGGLAIGPGKGGYGTLSFVAFDKGSNNEVLLTADHVMDGTSRMWQPDKNHSDARRVGNFISRSRKGNGQDITKYRVRSGINAAPRRTQRGDVPNVTGTWGFFGLADRVNPRGASLKSYVSAANHCRFVDHCYEVTKYGSWVYYQANFDDSPAGGGDSGGAYVDGNGKLVAIHQATFDPWHDPPFDVGGVGRPTLNAVGAKLYR
ncbi:MAG TPA: hypothetical protein VFJ06_04180 [Halococcus sp.]|nr:hypothetical protein [Halococcus sp.]